MATFATKRPFSGVRQMKYEQLLETNPAWVKKADPEELEEDLKQVEQRWAARTSEILEQLMEQNDMGPGKTHQGDQYFFDRIGMLEEQAKEQATAEALA